VTRAMVVPERSVCHPPTPALRGTEPGGITQINPEPECRLARRPAAFSAGQAAACPPPGWQIGRPDASAPFLQGPQAIVVWAQHVDHHAHRAGSSAWVCPLLRAPAAARIPELWKVRICTRAAEGEVRHSKQHLILAPYDGGVCPRAQHATFARLSLPCSKSADNCGESPPGGFRSVKPPRSADGCCPRRAGLAVFENVIGQPRMPVAVNLAGHRPGAWFWSMGDGTAEQLETSASGLARAAAGPAPQGAQGGDALRWRALDVGSSPPRRDLIPPCHQAGVQGGDQVNLDALPLRGLARRCRGVITLSLVPSSPRIRNRA